MASKEELEAIGIIEATEKCLVCNKKISTEECIENGGYCKECMNKQERGILEDTEHSDAIFHLVGSRGRELFVYENKCTIKVNPGVISFLTGNSTDGEKTIYYRDVIGVQHKSPGLTLGYIQLETAAMTMNNKSNNFFNENSFTYETNISEDIINEVIQFINKKIEECKSGINTTVKTQATSLEQIKTLKELLDMGAITQEEFDKKKKELLNL